MTHKIAGVLVKKKVKLVFEDGEELNISKENYLNSGYLFVGKIITDEQYFKIIRYESEEIYRQYLRRLVAKGNYSIYQLMVRLITKKNIEPSTARRLVGDLEREGKVDDHRYVERKVDTLKYKGDSPAKIKNYLLKIAKVRPEIVEEYFDKIEEIDSEFLQQEIARIWGQYKNRSVAKTKQCAMRNLIGKGYTASEASQMIDDYLSGEEQQKKVETQDQETIVRDAERCYRSVSNKTGNKKKAAFLRKMGGLGYNYRAILEVIEEVGYEFD